MGTPVLPVSGQPQPYRDGEFQPSAKVQDVSFATLKIPPPSPLYIGVDDTIGLMWCCNAASQPTLFVTGRFLRPSDGAIIPIFKQFPTSAVAYAINENRFQLGEGFLLNLCITSTIASGGHGQFFARAWLQRGSVAVSAANPISALLVSDYLYLRSPASWPGSVFAHPTDGAGNLIVNAPGNPAAGAQFSLNGVSTARRQMKAVNATLTTSAVAGNRFVSFGWSSLLVPAVAAQAASSVVTYRWIPNTDPYTAADGSRVMGLPIDYRVQLGGTPSSQVVNMDAGDQWSAITFDFEEWIDI
jgi:hypothetical protein